MSRPGRGWGNLKARPWYIQLRYRMVAGRETCRMCGRAARHESVEFDGLHLGHIRAHSLGGGNDRGNLTVVCGPCDDAMGDGDWTGIAPCLDDEDWTPPWKGRPVTKPQPEPLTHSPVLPEWLRGLGQ